MIKILILLLLFASAAHGEIYRWIDKRGTAHYTNSEYEIPGKYRNRAVILNLGLPAPANSATQPAQLLPEVKAPPLMVAPSIVAPSQRPRRRASNSDE